MDIILFILIILIGIITGAVATVMAAVIMENLELKQQVIDKYRAEIALREKAFDYALEFKIDYQDALDLARPK